MSNLETEEQQPEEDRLLSGLTDAVEFHPRQDVSVRRSDGSMQDDWKVMTQFGDRVMVYRGDGEAMLRKNLSIAELREMQPPSYERYNGMLNPIEDDPRVHAILDGDLDDTAKTEALQPILLERQQELSRKPFMPSDFFRSQEALDEMAQRHHEMRGARRPEWLGEIVQDVESEVGDIPSHLIVGVARHDDWAGSLRDPNALKMPNAATWRGLRKMQSAEYARYLATEMLLGRFDDEEIGRGDSIELRPYSTTNDQLVYMAVDGAHRVSAYKLLGREVIPARVESA